MTKAMLTLSALALLAVGACLPDKVDSPAGGGASGAAAPGGNGMATGGGGGGGQSAGVGGTVGAGGTTGAAGSSGGATGAGGTPSGQRAAAAAGTGTSGRGRREQRRQPERPAVRGGGGAGGRRAGHRRRGRRRRFRRERQHHGSREDEDDPGRDLDAGEGRRHDVRSSSRSRAARTMKSRAKAGATGAHRDVVLGVPGVDRGHAAHRQHAGGVDYKTKDYTGTTGAIPSRHAEADGLDVRRDAAQPRPLAVRRRRGLGGRLHRRLLLLPLHVLALHHRPPGPGRLVLRRRDQQRHLGVPAHRARRRVHLVREAAGQRHRHADGPQDVAGRPVFADGPGARSVRLLRHHHRRQPPLRHRARELHEITKAGTVAHDLELPHGVRRHFNCYSNTVNWNPADDSILMSLPVREHRRPDRSQDGRDRRPVRRARRQLHVLAVDLAASSFQHFPNITARGHAAGVVAHARLRHARDARRREPARVHGVRRSIAPTSAGREVDLRRRPEWPRAKGMAIRLANGNTLGNYGDGRRHPRDHARQADRLPREVRRHDRRATSSTRWSATTSSSTTSTR